MSYTEGNSFGDIEKHAQELHHDLDYLLTNGRKLDLDSVLTSNNDFDGVIVVTSDNRRAELIAVRRMVVGCAGLCTSTSVTFSSVIRPLSDPITDLYNNLQLVRAGVDAWVRSYINKGKQPPKSKKELAELLIFDMSMDENSYQEMLDNGIGEYMSSNLNCDINFFKVIE